MNETANDPVTKKVIIKHDGQQHCTAFREPDGKTVTMDCPYTGKGEELSPTNLVEAALGGCMLLSMGTLAMRSELDISGTEIDVKISTTDKSRMRFDAINITVKMPQNFSDKDRRRLEGAAEHCPIKHSFDSNVSISVNYIYPE